MKDFWLSKEQLSELRIAHRSEKNKHAAYRINAVILLGNGWKLKEVREALLLDEETLRSYMEKYQIGGVDELLKNNHEGRPVQLDESQRKQLSQELDRNIYPTTSAVIAYVEKHFGVRYSLSGMRDFLHRLGYEFKKPKLVPGEGDIQAQEIFVEQYEKFMEKKGSDVEVLFMDAVHPQHNTMAAYGWIKKGEKRCLKTNSGRTRLNLHGAINVETNEMTVIESPMVDKDSTLQLLELIENKYPHAREIVVILDNARYHYSKEVREWLQGRKLRLVFLPTYSPQLNLIERVWRFFKKKVLYNQYYAKLQDFRNAAINFFRNIGQYSEELTSLLDGGFEDFHYTYSQVRNIGDIWMPEERSHQIRTSLNIRQLFSHPISQFFTTAQRTARDACSFGVAPDQLVRIQIRRITW
jgi:transposase